MIVIVGFIGIIIGAAVMWAISTTSTKKDSLALAQSVAQLEATQERLREAQAQVEHERAEKQVTLDNLRDVFEATSQRVYKATVDTFSQDQDRLNRERDLNLQANIEPLTKLLDTYQRTLGEFDKEHRSALGDVKQRTEELLNAQRQTQEETRRLNQLLGRSDQRGRWGEIQLANVLEASGLRPGLDFNLQVSSRHEGLGQRPDCVVNLPNQTRIVVDAKFPYDDLEKSLAVDDPELRRQHKAAFAKRLREHIKELNTKAYWEKMEFTPDFTACFIPSDAALAAAYEADDTLHEFAMAQRVLLTSPTSLLALLWSAAEVLRHYDFVQNAQEILNVASELYTRIRNVAAPMADVGKALNQATTSYNKMVHSMEARLLTTARRVQEMGGAPGVAEMPALPELTVVAEGINATKWGVDIDDPDLLAQSEVIDAESPEVDDAQ